MNRTPVADWQQLSALYELADTLEPAALADWLAQLRSEEHPLLPQLEQMLSARSQVQHNDFLATPPRLPPPSEPRAIVWQADSRIGPYRLVSRLGSGGMAEVWLAQRDDGAFQRQVAIKLLFRNQASDALDTFAQRFNRERDILASLDHPHIAGLHDAGVTPTGQPWLALEYVEGETLTAWCDAQRSTVEARVRLFRQVLLAVQHAHANLVIHRDLKPGNILVTAQGEVRLLDFGIAKLMESKGATSVETELTRLAGRPMTRNYAAPEQLLGQPLTTACDVYSLGVVLYELLCGERPYELKVASAAQLEQAILDLDPRAPSRRALSEGIAKSRSATRLALRKQLGSDLDAIVLRTLAKQPGQRYGSVEALGLDLDRWLDGEPVEARAPSTVYRVGKFVRRHILSVSLGVAAVVALVGVTIVAVVMGLQAREDSARAVAARDFMLNIFQRADQEKSRGADITARDLLETGRKDVLTRLVGQPRLQAELLKGIAKIQSDMGEYVTADSTYGELSKLYLSLRQPRDAAFALADHADNAVRMSNASLASRLIGRARDLKDRPLDDAVLNARMCEVEGWVAISQGEAQLGHRLLSTCRQFAIAQLGENHRMTFKLGQALFKTDRDMRDLNGALALHRQLRAVADRVVGLDNKELAALDVDLVELLSASGKYSQALIAAEGALPRCIAAYGADEQYCRILFLAKTKSLLRLGYIARAMQDMPRIASLANDSTSPVLQVNALLQQFRLMSYQSDKAALQPLFDRVRAFAESGEHSSFRSTFKAAALLALAESRLRAADPIQAKRWITAAAERLASSGQQRKPSVFDAVGNTLMGVALLQQGRADSALEVLLVAQALFDKVLGEGHPMAHFYALNRAVVLARLGRPAEATELLMHADPVLREAFGNDAPAYARVARLRQLIAKAVFEGQTGDSAESASSLDFFS